jgi:hypothetical protein
VIAVHSSITISLQQQKVVTLFPLPSTMFRSFVRTIIASLVLLALSSSCSVAAFTGRRAFSTAATQRSAKTKLDAWSLPIPSELSSFGTMKSTWYNEHNPTARRTVYDE